MCINKKRLKGLYVIFILLFCFPVLFAQRKITYDEAWENMSNGKSISSNWLMTLQPVKFKNPKIVNRIDSFIVRNKYREERDFDYTCIGVLEDSCIYITYNIEELDLVFYSKYNDKTIFNDYKSYDFVGYVQCESGAFPVIKLKHYTIPWMTKVPGKGKKFKFSYCPMNETFEYDENYIDVSDLLEQTDTNNKTKPQPPH